MPCLDTTFLVDLLRRDPAAERKLREIEDSGQTLCTTPANLIELYVGAYRARDTESRLERIEVLERGLDLLELGAEECKRCGYVVADLVSRGEPIGTMDVIAGGIALCHGERVITRNVKHYRRITGLDVEAH
jgi:tRNA(fMet)-specific endonuclease VapC